MNEKEAKAIVEKIIHADKVIHAQQLDIQWRPPTDMIFSQMSQVSQAADSQSMQGDALGGSLGPTNTHSDSNAHSTNEMEPEMSQHTDLQGQGDKAIKYERIKNVFKLLIEEADYLIDERAYERCQTATVKEQFSIKIDSIRKSLGIENMEDVQLLVDICYGFEAKFNRE